MKALTLLLIGVIGISAEPVGNCPSTNRNDEVDFLIDDNDCNKFYKCDWGNPVLYKCPSDLHFNPKLNVCDYPDQAGCEGANNQEITTNSSPTLPSVNPGRCMNVTCPYIPGEFPVFHAHPDDCGRYCKCDNYGTVHDMPCPDGLHFNTELNVCDWPENAGCEGSDTTNANPDGTPSTPEATTTNKPEEITTPESTSDNPLPTASTPDNSGKCANVSCPYIPGEFPVFHVHPEDCGRYCKCDNYGTVHDMPCPDGLHFNTELNVCDWPENAGCGGTGTTNANPDGTPSTPEATTTNKPDEITTPQSTTVNPLPTVPIPDNSEKCGNVSCPYIPGEFPIFHAHPEDCGRYCKCDNYGTVYDMPCPDGLHFNTDLNVCDWPENAGCEVSNPVTTNPDSSPSTEATTTTNGPVTTTESPVTTTISPETATPDTTTTNQPTTTKPGSCAGVSCPYIPGDFPVFHAHPDDCGRYCKCDNYGTVHDMPCPDGLHFNTELNVCDWPENAGCEDSNPATTNPDSSPSTEATTTTDAPVTTTDAPITTTISPETATPDTTTTNKPTTTKPGGCASASCPYIPGEFPVFHAHPDDCGRYCKCDNYGTVHDMACPDGLHFNTELNVCDWPENAGCEDSNPATTNPDSSPSTEATTTTNAPVTTTDAPVTTTDAPATATDAPVTTTESPVITTISPETVTPDTTTTNQPTTTKPAGCASVSCPYIPGEFPVFHAHPDDCGRYCKCDNYGTVHDMPCPDGLHFNTELNVCDWPENAGCEDFNPATTNPDSSPSTEATTTTNAPVTTTDAPVTTTDAPATATDAPVTTTESPVTTTISPETVTPDTTTTNQPTTTKPAGCASVSCPYIPGEFPVFHAHPDDCGRYCKCDNYGTVHDMPCPDGLHFNTELNVCDWPENAGCEVSNPATTNPDSSPSTEHPTTTTASVTTTDAPVTTTESPVTTTISPETVTPDATTTKPGSCGSVSCPYIPGEFPVFHAHPDDCGRYCKCDNYGTVHDMPCPDGLHFNTDLNVCDWPENAGCEDSNPATTNPDSSPNTEAPTTTTAPITTTDAPATTTDAPVTTTDAPVTTTDSPATTTDAPATTTDAPVTTTDAPPTTTDAPATTTDAAVTTTDAAVTTTISPETVTPDTTTTNQLTTSKPGGCASVSCPYIPGEFPVFHAHPDDCGRYCKCDNYGTVHDMPCPDGLHFNTELNVCDWPENAGCEVSNPATTNPDSSPSTEHPSTTTASVTTTDAPVTTTESPVTTTISPETVTPDATTTKPGSCGSVSCPYIPGEFPVFHAHPDDCGRYCKCDNYGTVHDMPCPDGLHFNTDLNVCDWPENAGCEDSNPATTNPDSSPNTEAPTTTTAPITTTDAPATTTDAPVTTTDAPATTTDAPVTTTDAPVTTTDAPETVTPDTTTTNQPTTTKPGSCAGVSCPYIPGEFPVFHAHPDDCGRYCKCDNYGTVHDMPCPDGLHFNTELNVCDWPENAGCEVSNPATTSPDSSPSTEHPTTTTASVTTTDAPVTTTESPVTTTIYPETVTPDTTTTKPGSCGSVSCPYIPGEFPVFHAHPDDCGRYCKCDNYGTVHDMPCPDGLHFNTDLNVCDWPENAGCEDSNPATTNPDSSPNTEAPTTTTAPITTTDAPATTSDAPVTTTDAPATTTDAPVTTTDAPVTTTDAPETVTPDTTTTNQPTTTKPGSCAGVSCPYIPGEFPVFHAHPDDCGRYCKCDNYGTVHDMPCPDGLHFNTELNVCDWPENAGCEVSNPATTSPDSSPSTEHPTTTTASVTTTDAPVTTTESPVTTTIYPETVTPDTTTTKPGSCGSVSCPYIPGEFPVFHAHPDDCGRYCKCDNYGTVHDMPCPDGLHFNTDLNVCDWPENAGCEDSNPATTNPDSSPNTEAPTTTTAPITTTDAPATTTDAPVTTTDAPATTTDAPVTTTDAPVTTTDVPETVTPDTTTTNQPTTTKPGSCAGVSCPYIPGEFPVFHAHPDDCGRYCKCDNYGTVHDMPCPDGLHFNTELNVCDWPENAGCEVSNPATISPDSSPSTEHPTTTTASVTTTDAPVTTTESPVTTTISPETVTPDTTTTKPGSCGSVSCPYIPGEFPVFHAHPDDCGRYCKCDNYGTVHDMPCPDGLHFNTDLNVCDWPENAGCEDSNPATTNPDSSPNTEAPTTTTAPITTTDAPATTTDAPVTTSDAPATTTDAPVTTTDAPETVTPDATTINPPTTTKPGGCASVSCPYIPGEFPVFHAHPDDCGRYCKCDNYGIVHDMPCPDGLHFNTELNVCDWPENVGCEVSNPVTTNPDSSPSTEAPITTTAPVTTTDAPATTTDAPVTTTDAPVTTTISPETTAPDTTTTNPPTTTKPGGCASVSCPYIPGEFPVFHAHPDNCGRYCKCDNYGTVHDMPCPDGLHFNVELNVCDWPDNAGCDSSGASTSKPNTTPTTTELPGSTTLTTEVPEESTSNPTNPTTSPAEDCSSVICPSENEDFPVFHSHPKMCDRYCKCDWGIAYDMPCPPGLHFNPILEVCDYPSDAGCPHS